MKKETFLASVHPSPPRMSSAGSWVVVPKIEFAQPKVDLQSTWNLFEKVKTYETDNPGTAVANGRL